MTWQRARMVVRDSDVPFGFEFWVQARAPETHDDLAYAVESGRFFRGRPDPEYLTNVRPPALSDPIEAALRGSGRAEATLRVAACAVELLGRGPEDFCDDPPRIPWGAWAKDGVRE